MSKYRVNGAPAYLRRALGLAHVLIITGIMAAAVLATAPKAIAQNFAFSRIEIDGNRRIEDASILAFAGIAPGQPLSAAQLNDAQQAVQNSGLFQSVDFDPRGATLRITVVELPTINRISFEGNRRISDDELALIISSSPRRVYSPTVAEQDTAAIVAAYEAGGRFAAGVEAKIIRRSENRVDLVFEISEGRVTEIERVSFVGNRNYSDRRLRRVLGTKQANVLRQLIQRDTFVADRIEFDRQVLRDFYLSRGYVDFQVLSVTPEFSRERNATFITFNVREGQQFKFGELTASSEIPEIDADEYLAVSRIRPGRNFTPTGVDNTITRMERLALRQGVDFVRVEPRITRNDRDLTLDIEFVITRGQRVFVERIDIEGNQTTLDRVVRRQFLIVEGDPFNPNEIRSASERIRALNFFSTVDVSTREGSGSDQVIVDVDVEEQPTGTLGFGATYTVSQGVGFLITFNERNFLGRGQTLSFDINTTGETASVEVNFIEPAFLSRDVAFNVGLFSNQSDNDNSFFSTSSVGGRVGLTFPVGENSTLLTQYELSVDEVSDVDAGSSPIIAAEAGTRTTSSIGYRYTYDTRRSGLNPTAGVLLSFGQDLAGIGGDNQFIRTTARAVAQADVLNEEVSVSATLEGGALVFLSGDSRVIDRFFLSSRQLRGFSFRGVGPRDLVAANEDALGGNYYFSARLNADFPLGLPEELGISGGVFAHAGSVWGLDNTDGAGGAGSVDDSFNLRTSVGVAINWDTPIGPLVFSFSQPISSEDFDEEQVFDISIRTQF